LAWLKGKVWVTVRKPDRTARQVESSDGQRIGYDALLLATGSTPRPLDVPGAYLDGVLQLRTLPDSAHCFLIKHGAESVVARLNLTGERDLLTILSGRERTVRLLDEIRAERGDDPADWIPRLLEVA